MLPEALIVVLGVVLIVEGLPWFLSPRGTKRMLSELSQLNDNALRVVGLVFMLAGLLLVYFVKGQSIYMNKYIGSSVKSLCS
mgnify:CR=1 FL=1